MEYEHIKIYNKYTKKGEERRINMKKKFSIKCLKPYLFLLPVLSLLIVFKYIPFIMAIEKSFFNWNGSTMNVFVGLQNYIEAFKDKMFLEGIRHAVIVMFVQVAITLTIPLLAAELLYAVKSSRIQYAVRTAFTFPMVVPGVVVILLWQWILNGDTGVLNNLLNSIGLENLAQPWLGSTKTALGSILAIGFPWIGMATLGGMQFLIYFGALQSIPKDLFEAAQLEGITVWKRFLKIDIPMISSQLKLMATLVVISSLQVFESIYILTKGGPGTSTMVPAVYMYEQGFTYGRMGYCSALGVLLFLLILILTFIMKKFVRESEGLE